MTNVKLPILLSVPLQNALVVNKTHGIYCYSASPRVRAVLDVIENLALFQTLRRDIQE